MVLRPEVTHTGPVTLRAHPVSYAYADYLAHEEACNTKNEFLGGQIYAMAGASPQHNRLCVAVGALLLPQLARGRCRAHSSDQRVRVPETGLATYPDVTVICGPIALDPDDPRQHTATNPTLIVEVLSPSTETYDRGEKFEHYRKLESMRQYVLVAQDERVVEVWTRSEKGWSEQCYQAGEVGELNSVAARLDVDALYRAASPPS